MPDSYGRPLCSSPRFRCETSHAAPIVRNTNDTPAKANPTTYQMPVNRTPFERRATGRRRLSEDPPLSAQTYPERASGPMGILAVGTGRAGTEPPSGGVSGSGPRRARVQVRVPLPVRSCPTVVNRGAARVRAAIGTSPYSECPSATEAVRQAGERWPLPPATGEGHHPEPPHRSGIEQAHERRTDGEVALERRRRVGLDRAQQVLGAEADKELGLGRRAEMGETGGARSGLDRGDVDVGGEVLATDVGVRVVKDAMAEVGAERAIAAPNRVVEVGCRVAVVDEEQDASLEPGGGGVHPGAESERDLRALALGELDGLL